MRRNDMSCGLDKDKLTGYFDGELDEAERSEVERHIGVCSECLRELEEIKSASLTVRGLPRYAVPPAVTEGVLREVARGSAGIAVFRPKPRSWLPWALTAAAAIFVAVNVVYFTSLPRRADPTPPPNDVAVRSGTSGDPGKSPPGLKLEGPDSYAKSEGGENLRADKPVSSPGKQVPPFYSVVSSDVADARARVEKTLREMGVAYSTGAGEFDQSSYAKDTCIEVEATDEQLMALGGRLSGERMVWKEGAAGYRSERGRLSDGEDVEQTPSGGGGGKKKFAEPDSRSQGAATEEKKDKVGEGKSSEPGRDRPAAKEGEKTKRPGPAEKAEKKVRAVIFFHEVQKPTARK